MHIACVSNIKNLIYMESSDIVMIPEVPKTLNSGKEGHKFSNADVAFR